MRNASIQEIMVTRARATFSHRINFDTISLGNVNLMIAWCRENCTGVWREENYHALYFQFEESRDATMFMLRWGSADGNKLK
jgi:hypothetical protein